MLFTVGRPCYDSVMLIRVAHAGDVAAIAELMGELGYPCTAEQISRRYAKLRAAGDQLFLAEQDGLPVGMIGYSSRPYLSGDGEAGRITNLVVKSSARRLGVGRKLVEYVENEARKRGHSSIELTTRATRTDAHQFYRNLQYQETSKKFVKHLV